MAEQYCKVGSDKEALKDDGQTECKRGEPEHVPEQ